MYFVFSSFFWHKATKTLGISCDESDKGTFYYVNEMTFRNHLRVGPVASGVSWNFQSCSQTSPERREAGNWPVCLAHQIFNSSQWISVWNKKQFYLSKQYCNEKMGDFQFFQIYLIMASSPTIFYHKGRKKVWGKKQDLRKIMKSPNLCSQLVRPKVTQVSRKTSSVNVAFLQKCRLELR